MDLETALIDEYARVHGAHTLLLYGSRARGDATAESDVDVAAFAEVPRTLRDARLFCGVYLDGFVYPTAHAQADDVDLLKLRGCKVLLDARGLAAPLLARLDELERKGPPPLPADELQMRRVWAHKTLARIRRGDSEAHYRRHWLLYELLHDHFAHRGLWYRGPKVALAELERDAPATFALFAAALAPGAPDEALAALVNHVSP